MRPALVALLAHSAAILLTDAASGDVVSLDYKKALSLDLRAGAIRAVRLALPAGAELPARIKGLRDRRCVPARLATVVKVPATFARASCFTCALEGSRA